MEVKQSDTQTAPASRTMIWAGRIISALPVLALLMSGTMKLTRNEGIVEAFKHLEYDLDLAIGLGILEIVCTIVYAIPQTSVLGAILLTGYLGGAVATHVRIGEQFIAPVVLGVLIWGGLYLRDVRLRAILPLRG